MFARPLLLWPGPKMMGSEACAKSVLAASLIHSPQSGSVVEATNVVRPLDEGRMLFENLALR